MLTALEIRDLYNEHYSLQYVARRCSEAMEYSGRPERSDVLPLVLNQGGASGIDRKSDFRKDVEDSLITLLSAKATARAQEIERLFATHKIALVA